MANLPDAAQSRRPALLALEDGSIFHGVAAGADGESGGELVFNTGLTGYQEILTDPSYCGQIVTMTCPEIGNYGTTPEDRESARPAVAGLVVRESSPIASNWRAESALGDYLASHGIVAIAGVDTRALTRRLRSAGVMRAVVATLARDQDELVARARALPVMEGADLARTVTCRRPFVWPAAGDSGIQAHDGLEPVPAAFAFGGALRSGDAGASRPLVVAALDFGMKWNILRRLAAHGCRVHVFPADTPAEAMLAVAPDGFFLSNGPGDPAAVGYAIQTARRLLETGRPIFGICLGHQILALALGARTYKLKFGHRGTNHPVRDRESGLVEITSQNHGFAVDARSLPASAVLTHESLYDGTVEGFRLEGRPVFCVQYHPEASPGPHDADHLFGRFASQMARAAAR